MDMPSVAPELRRANGDSNPTESQSPLTDLVAALEHAALTTKQLSSSSSSSSDPSHLLNAYASLRNAHLKIGAFLARFDSVRGAIEDEPMAEGDDSSESKIIEKVEEGMRDCALQQSKRPKRPLSPFWAAVHEDGPREASSYDPRERLRSLDLVFQFRG